MLLKLVKKYNYVALIIVSTVIMSLITLSVLTKDTSEYISIQVKQGDTLWELADKYEEKTSLSKDKFIKWTKEENKLNSDNITIGQVIVLPVKK
jgi:LysM repeat protein